MNTESMTITMEADPLEPTQIEKARITAAHLVARSGGGVADLEDTLMMLGLHPSQQGKGPTLPPSQLPNAPTG